MAVSMKKIQEVWKNLGVEIKQAILSFPITMFFVTCWMIIQVAIQNRVDFFLEWKEINIFFGLMMPGSLLIETLCVKNLKKRLLFESIPLIISVLISYMSFIQRDFWKRLVVKKYELCWGGYHRYMVGYILLVATLTFYIWYKRSGKRIETYCLLLLQEFFRVTVIYVALSIGSAFIMGTFVNLILNGKHREIIFQFENVVLALYYIPALVIALDQRKEERVSRFMERVVKYVFLPIVLMSMVIVYLYLIKMMIPFTIPSNQIFFMLGILFFVGMIMWTLIGHFHNESIFIRVAEKMPYAFLPLLLLQGYTLGIRLAHYGLNPNRYLGIMLMIFEFLYFCIYRLDKDRISHMIIVFGIMIVIAMFIPGINMMKMSIDNQKNILEQYFREDSEEESEELWERMYGAYEWLSKQPECADYLKIYYTSEDVDKLKEKGIPGQKEENEFIDIFEQDLMTEINVTDYKTVIPVMASFEGEADLSAVQFQENVKKENGKNGYTIDTNAYFNSCIVHCEQYYDTDNKKVREFFEKNNEIKISEQEKIVIESISFSYSKNSHMLNKYKIKGYLLIK